MAFGIWLPDKQSCCGCFWSNGMFFLFLFQHSLFCYRIDKNSDSDSSHNNITLYHTVSYTDASFMSACWMLENESETHCRTYFPSNSVKYFLTITFYSNIVCWSLNIRIDGDIMEKITYSDHCDSTLLIPKHTQYPEWETIFTQIPFISSCLYPHNALFNMNQHESNYSSWSF